MVKRGSDVDEVLQVVYDLSSTATESRELSGLISCIQELKPSISIILTKNVSNPSSRQVYNKTLNHFSIGSSKNKPSTLLNYPRVYGTSNNRRRTGDFLTACFSSSFRWQSCVPDRFTLLKVGSVGSSRTEP